MVRRRIAAALSGGNTQGQFAAGDSLDRIGCQKTHGNPAVCLLPHDPAPFAAGVGSGHLDRKQDGTVVRVGPQQTRPGVLPQRHAVIERGDRTTEFVDLLDEAKRFLFDGIGERLDDRSHRLAQGLIQAGKQAGIPLATLLGGRRREIARHGNSNYLLADRVDRQDQQRNDER